MTSDDLGRRAPPARWRRIRRGPLLLVAAAVLLASCTSGDKGTSPASTRSPGGPGTSGSPTATEVHGRIAFDRMVGVTNYEGSYLGTFVANADGTHEQRLPIPKGWAGPTGPVWSPDGTQLVINLWHEPNGPGRAALIRPDGSGFRILPPGNLDASMGCSAWSPDGMTLLCPVQGKDPSLDGIYSIGVDGTGLRRLTRSPFHDTVGSAGECGGGDVEADYSPDGSQFVFMRKRCGTGPDPSSAEAGALFVENTDGTGLRRITKYGDVRSHPGGGVHWSPHGTQILFESQDLGLHLVRPDGSGSSEVHLPLGGAESPAWSPDGDWIIFSFARYTSTAYAHICRALPDGTHLTTVSNSPNSDFLVSWGQLPGG